MPRHKRTTCRKTGGPISKHCSCEHCALAVCSVCGAYEGGLTTDCPGKTVSFDRQQEVGETNLDYTDDRGWYQGEPPKAPRFENTELPPTLPRIDPRTQIAPTIDWAAVDRNADLQRELGRKGIAWVIAERNAEDVSARCTRLEDELDARKGRDLDANAVALQDELEIASADFHLADQRAQKCEDEFKQAARLLVDGLEAGSLSKEDPAP